MFIDKRIDLVNIKYQSRDYYILMNNIIDCCLTLKDVRNCLYKKSPSLCKIVDNNELLRMRRLYCLLREVQLIKWK
jgi:hypothetical protein